MFKQDGHFVLLWKPSVKSAAAATGYRKQGYKCPMRALEQALSDQPGTSILPYVPILAGGKGGKGRNTDHKAAALACISELSGDGFATFQSVEVQPPRSYAHEELIPLIRDWTLSQYRAALANAKQQKKDLGEDGMDRMLRCLLIQHAECEKYVVARNRALGMVVRFDSDRHYDI